MTDALELRDARVRAHNAGMAELVAQLNWMENIDETKDATLENVVKVAMNDAAVEWQNFTEVCAKYKESERARRANAPKVVEVAEGVFEVHHDDAPEERS